MNRLLPLIVVLTLFLPAYARSAVPIEGDADLMQQFAEAVGVPTLASGGVAGPEDIVKLAAVAQPNRIEGVIIGKALYAGRLTLADALRIASGGPTEKD